MSLSYNGFKLAIYQVRKLSYLFNFFIRWISRRRDIIYKPVAYWCFFFSPLQQCFRPVKTEYIPGPWFGITEIGKNGLTIRCFHNQPIFFDFIHALVLLLYNLQSVHYVPKACVFLLPFLLLWNRLVFYRQIIHSPQAPYRLGIPLGQHQKRI